MKLSDFKPTDGCVEMVNHVLRQKTINPTVLNYSYMLTAMLSSREEAAFAHTGLLLYAAQLQARVRELEAQVKDKDERLEDLLDSQP